ncbi:MAG: GNAT family N-acetyltransferase [Anaerolineales bacterium]|nr:GNAT family N-acetyltransferase [Anaerolineales bacterium]
MALAADNLIRFAPVAAGDRSLIIGWLQQPHVSQWLHGAGLQNTLDSLDQFLEGEAEFDHWLVSEQGAPFAYLLTSTVDQMAAEVAAVPFAGDRAITLDVFIGEPDYLGKGLGTALIQQFIERQFPEITDVLIDPEATNARAIHVYQKLGFRIIETFIAPWHPVPHYLMHLDCLAGRHDLTR